MKRRKVTSVKNARDGLYLECRLSCGHVEVYERYKRIGCDAPKTLACRMCSNLKEVSSP